MKIFFTFLFLLVSSPAFSAVTSFDATAKVWNLADYNKLSLSAMGSTYMRSSLAATSGLAPVATATAAGVSRKALAFATGSIPYIGLACTAYLTYAELRTAMASNPVATPTLAAAFAYSDAQSVVPPTGGEFINGSWYTKTTVESNPSMSVSVESFAWGEPSNTNVTEGTPPGPVKTYSTNWLCNPCNGNVSTTRYPRSTRTVNYILFSTPVAVNQVLTNNSSVLDPAYLHDLDILFKEAMTHEPATSETTYAVSVIESLKNDITTKVATAASTASTAASSHVDAENKTAAASNARQTVNVKMSMSAVDPTNAIKAAASADAARDALTAANLAVTAANLDKVNSNIALTAAQAAVTADQNQTGIMDSLATLSANNVKAIGAANAANIAQVNATSVLQSAIAAQNAADIAASAGASQRSLAQAAADALAASLADPSNQYLANVSANAQAALATANNNLTSATSSATEMAAAAQAASLASAQTLAAVEAKAAAEQQAAADSSAADAATAKLHDNSYDSSIVAPDKKSISSLLSTFLAASPLVTMIKSFVLTTNSSLCSVSLGSFYGHDLKLDFCRYSELFTNLGGLLLGVSHGFAILVVVRGWKS